MRFSIIDAKRVMQGYGPQRSITIRVFISSNNRGGVVTRVLIRWVNIVSVSEHKFKGPIKRTK